MFHILQVLVDVVRVHDTRETSADAQDLDLAVLRVVVDDVWDVVARTARLRIVPFRIVDGVEVWSHAGRLLSKSCC